MESCPQQRGRRCLCLLILLSILLLASAGTGQGQTPSCVEVNAPGPDRVFCTPGSVLTAAVTVTNNSAVPHTYIEQLRLPQGIRRLMSGEPFAVAPGKTEVRLLSIFIPVAQPAGPMVLRYAVQDSADASCAAEALLVAFVKAIRSIDMKAATVPRYVIPGETSTVVFAVRNAGNEAANLLLRATSADAMEIRLDSSTLWLNPGETQLVRVQATPSPGIPQHQRQALQLRGILKQDSTVQSEATVAVETILRAATAEEPMHEIPASVTVRATGENGRAGGQIDIEAGGTLTPERNDRVDIFIRTPDIQSRSVLGYRDEYRVSYRTDQYEIYLGDRSYGLSPLTEVGRTAFGLEGIARWGDFSAGAFANRTRFYSPSVREQAGFAGYTIAEGTTVWTQYLHKDEAVESNVGSLRGIVRLYGRTDLDLEYGLSSRDHVSDRAYNARLHGGESLISYDVWYLHAGPEYGGYYRDLDIRSASFTLHPWKRLRIEGYYRDEDRNLQEDSLVAASAPHTRSYRFAAGYGEVISLGYTRSEGEDRLPTPRFNRQEDLLELRSGFIGPVTSMIGTVELGKSRDRLQDQEGNAQRYALSANIRPDDYQRYGLSAEYVAEHTLLTWTLVERWAGTANATVRIGERTRITASVAATRYTTPTVQTSTTTDIVLTHTFPFRHTITLRGRQDTYDPGTDGKDAAWLVEYTIPIGVPISRPSSTGTIRGHVFDGADMRGIPDMIVYTGDRAAITNEYGEFVFPALAPDRYEVRLDLGDVGSDRVASTPLPREVYVRGGEDSQTDIVLVRGVSLSGAVRIFDFPEQGVADSTKPAFVESGGQANITIELSGPGDTLRQLTDGRGQFRFRNVRPGAWSLRAIDGTIPSNHYFERDTAVFELSPGESRQILFRVLPKKRVVRIIQEGTLNLQPPIRPSKPAAPFTTVDGCLVSPARGGTGYIVQVSVWTSRSDATKGADKIRKTTGFSAAVESGAGGTYRVVMGPFPTELEAASACTRVRQAGQ